MVRGAVAVVVLMAAAGCVQVSATEVALGAAADLEAAYAEVGDLSGLTIAMSMDFGEGSITAQADMALHEGDGFSEDVWFSDVELGDPDMEAALEGLRFTVVCSPDRIVLITEGLEEAGMDDIDAETANSAATCLTEAGDHDGLQALADDVMRLMSEAGPTMGAALGAVDFRIPSYEVVSAEWDGDDVVAVYEVDGQEVETTARIMDGRIVSDLTTTELPGLGTMDIATHYRYGERTADPGIRGATTV